MSGKSKRGPKEAPPRVRRAVGTIPLRVSADLVREQARQALGVVWDEAQAIRWLKSEGAQLLEKAMTNFLPQAIQAAIRWTKDEAQRKAMEDAASAKVVVAKKKGLLGPDGLPLR